MSKAALQHTIDSLRLMERFSKRGTFDRVLGIDGSSINSKDLTMEGKSFTLRLSVDPRLYTLRKDRISLSTYMSLIDVVTTANIIGAGYGKSNKPGVSVQLQAERVPTADKLPPPKDVDVVSTVTKLGRSLAFCKAEVRNVESGDLICFGTHIKYLPTGSVVMDLALSPWFFPLVKWYFLTQRSQPPVEDGLDSLKDTVYSGLEQQGVGRGLFTVQTKHTNGFGLLHGGCQAILMEIVGGTLAKHELKAEKVSVESMQVHYQSSGRGTVQLVSEVISPANDGRVSISIQINKDHRPISEATLQFSKSK